MPDGLAALGENEPSQSSLRDASSPEGGSFWHRGKFLIALDALVTGLTACALSVKAYGFDSSPKGRAKP